MVHCGHGAYRDRYPWRAGPGHSWEAVADIDALRAAGWSERGIWQATALVSFFNFSGRLEAAAGLPPDDVPMTSRLKEAAPDGSTALSLSRKGD